jgi:hypothetical protein
MDLKTEILREHSKRQVIKIASWIGPDKRRFRQLMDLFLKGEYRITQRSAWIISECAERHPFLTASWIAPMVKKMQEPGVHVAVKRNVLRLLSCTDIPPKLLGTVVSLCFDELESPDSAIAVRVHAMSIVLNVAQHEPDLRNELQTLIEQMLPHAGPAIRSRAGKVLKKLEKIKTNTNGSREFDPSQKEQPRSM